MYENYTYDYILKSILDRISEGDSTIDIREGSAIWYAVAPVAAELAIAYTNLDAVSKESFVGTATREGIYLACNDIGLDTTQFEPSASVFYGHFDTEISINSRWSCGDYIFLVSSKIGMVSIDGVEYHQYRLECETLGSHTQYTLGNLKPITEYGSKSLQVAVIDSCVTVGRDEVSDERVREIYFDYISNNSEGGNVAQYRQWMLELEGVGANKVISAWNGLNTVKVVILDENNESPSEERITAVQNYLDPNSEGLGEGKAPIGAVVTVDGGTNAYINVSAILTLSATNADISDITTNLRNYFRKIAFQKNIINIYEVASIILASPSVTDVNDVKLGRWVSDDTPISYTTSNLILSEYETPVLHQFVAE